MSIIFLSQGIEDAVIRTGVEENIGLVTFGGRAKLVQNLTNDYSRVIDKIGMRFDIFHFLFFLFDCKDAVFRLSVFKVCIFICPVFYLSQQTLITHFIYIYMCLSDKQQD